MIINNNLLSLIDEIESKCDWAMCISHDKFYHQCQRFFFNLVSDKLITWLFQTTNLLMWRTLSDNQTTNVYMWIWKKKKLSMETSNWTNTKAFKMWMWNICALYAYRFKLWNGVEVLRDILLPLLPLPKVMRIKWSQITSLFYFISILFKCNIWTVAEGFYSLQINAYIEMPSNIIHSSLVVSAHLMKMCAEHVSKRKLMEYLYSWQ